MRAATSKLKELNIIEKHAVVCLISLNEMHKLPMYVNMNRNVMVIKITLVDGLQQLIYCF
jgi:hypothetical protein